MLKGQLVPFESSGENWRFKITATSRPREFRGSKVVVVEIFPHFIIFWKNSWFLYTLVYLLYTTQVIRRMIFGSRALGTTHIFLKDIVQTDPAALG